jgi:hypothetical protein
MKKFIYAALFVLITLTAHAQVVYTLRTAYDTAHPLNYVVDFNNFGPDGTFYPSGLTASTPGGNVTFLGTPQTATSTEILSATHFGFSSPANANNFVLWGLSGQFAVNSLLITLPANTFSFGTDIISPSSTVPEPYTFTIMSGTSVLDVISSPSISGSYTFVGFDSLSSPITSIAVQITNIIGNPEPVIDNFTVVPEPSTWLAAVLALGVIGFSQRKRCARLRVIRGQKAFLILTF